MLAIGRALVAQPKLILFDEPSLGLSPKLVEDIFTIIARINAEAGTSMLLVEQNATVALAVAHQDYIMENGKIVIDGTAEHLASDPDVREFYLGAYRKLAEKLDIPILGAETSDGIHFNMATWIEDRALDMVRVSSHYKGGFTGSMKIAHMAESFGMRAEVHGMGLENAQLCAAISNNDYYEQIIMNEEQMKGLAGLGPLAIVDGMLTASDEPGVGYHPDFADLDKRALAKIEVTEHHA